MMTPPTRLKTERPEPTRLDVIVRDWLQCSWNQARAAIASGKIWHEDGPLTDPGQLLTVAELEYRVYARRADRDNVLAAAAVAALTDDYIVVRKPAGLMTVPFKNERDTLEARVRRWLGKKRGQKGRPYLGWVHRLDKETSGLVVFATSTRGKQVLQHQFQTHAAQRVYHALVEGQADSATIETHLVANRGDGKRGSLEKIPSRRRHHLGAPQRAVTHVHALQTGQRISRVICHLETGRTHQIRIHLSEAGNRIVGDPVYGETQLPREIVPPRMFLHAVELAFDDPATGQRVTFEDPLPASFDAFWQQLES